MTPYLVMELKKHKLAGSNSEFDLVFCNSKGKPIDPDNIGRQYFLPALREAKIRQVRFHDLRHTNVALRIEQGQNVVYISRQVGHSSVKTTLDIYGHLIKEVNTEQAKKLDNILGFAELSEKPVRRLLEDEAKTEQDSLVVSLPVKPSSVVANA